MNAWRPIVGRAVLLVACGMAQADSPATPGAFPGDKICTKCQRHFSSTDRFCPIDGIPLVDVASDGERVCPHCQRLYPSSVRFCSVDGAPLRASKSATKRPDAAGPTRNAENRAEPAPAADHRAADPAADAAAAAGHRGVPGDDVRPRIAGARYIAALRSSLLHAPLGAEAAELDAAERQFLLERRIVIALEIEAREPALQAACLAWEQELADRLHQAGPRDLELVPPRALNTSMGARRILITVRASAAAGAGALRFDLALRDSDAGVEIGHEMIAVQPAGTGPKRYDDVPRLLAAAAGRRLRRVLYDDFDEAVRAAQAGATARAVEHDLAFLFNTPDFDSPQAERANDSVASQLQLSVLDWLWGEPEFALPGARPSDATSNNRPAGAGAPREARRRLPLGFRRAADEPFAAGLPRGIVCLRDASEMVLVPPATLAMGDDAGQPDERPAHAVSLAPFYADKFETSVAAYDRFLRGTGAPPPQPATLSQAAQWASGTPRPDCMQLPVVHVRWQDAVAYSLWAGKSLPSEAQWERAARGRFSADYPRPMDPGFAARLNAQGAAGGAGRLLSVFSFPGAMTAYGCQSMLGNAAEWCQDWYDAGYYARSDSGEPIGPPFGDRRVVRGGSWQTPLTEIAPSRRAALPPDTRSPSVGFRCVLNLPAEN